MQAELVRLILFRLGKRPSSGFRQRQARRRPARKAAVRSAVEVPLEAAREAAAASDRSRRLGDPACTDAASASGCAPRGQEGALAGREAESCGAPGERIDWLRRIVPKPSAKPTKPAPPPRKRCSPSMQKRTLAKTVGIPAEELDLTALAAPDPVSGDALERLVPFASSASVRNAAKDRESADACSTQRTTGPSGALRYSARI